MYVCIVRAWNVYLYCVRIYVCIYITLHQHACMHPTHTHIHYTYILHSGVWTLDHCESPMSIVQCFEHRILGNQLYPMYAFRIDPHETSITKWVHLFVALGPLKKKLGSVVGTNYPLFHYGTLRCCFETHIWRANKALFIWIRSSIFPR